MDQEKSKQAIHQQALRLRQEFPNLEEIRSWVTPRYDPTTGHAEIVFQGPEGSGHFRWSEEGQVWNIVAPDGHVRYASAGQLRETLRALFQEMREQRVVRAMQQQVLYIRDEFGGIEEIESWARPVYNHEEQRAEVRFDTPMGVCRFWREAAQWNVQLPDGSITHAPIGKLREYITQVRQFLRKGY